MEFILSLAGVATEKAESLCFLATNVDLKAQARFFFFCAFRNPSATKFAIPCAVQPSLIWASPGETCRAMGGMRVMGTRDVQHPAPSRLGLGIIQAGKPVVIQMP